MGGPSLGVFLTFLTTSVERELTAYVGTSFDATDNYVFQTSTNHTFDLATMGFDGNCTAGCAVFIKVKATCNYQSCLNSISTRIWARIVHRANNTYVFTNEKLPYMPLYLNKWSPVTAIPKGSYKYFTFAADAAGSIKVAKDTSIGAEMTVLGGKNEIAAPTTDNTKWVMTVDEESKEFVAGDNYIGLHGTDQMSFLTADGRVCVGELCAGSALVPAALFLLVSAIAALF